MRVCVVGAGPCGLTTVKQLRDEGHEVVCYDKYSGLGGIWLREGDDDGTKTKAFDNPKLFTQVWFGSFNPSAYHIVGPHSLGKAALKDLYSERVGGNRLHVPQDVGPAFPAIGHASEAPVRHVGCTRELKSGF